LLKCGGRAAGWERRYVGGSLAAGWLRGVGRRVVGGQADEDAGFAVVEEAGFGAVQGALVLGAVAPDVLELVAGEGGDESVVVQGLAVGRAVGLVQAADQVAHLGDDCVGEGGGRVLVGAQRWKTTRSAR
jgi:hypothetical protein